MSILFRKYLSLGKITIVHLRSIYTIFISTAILAACSPHERADIMAESPGTIEKVQDNVEPGMLNILISDETATRIDAGEDPVSMFEALNPTAVMRLFPYDSVFEKRQRDAGLHKWYTVYFDKTKSMTKASGIASAIPGIIEVEPVLRAESEALTFPFNDPYAITRQWHLLNDGTMLSGFRKGADINVVPVWEEFTAGSNNVIVGVIDSGIQYDHPDLQGAVIPPGENGSKSFFVSNILTPYSYSTIDNHGTHVAGIIAAINNNGIGVSGIAGGNDGTGGVRILDCQAIGQSSVIAQAVQWAANHGAVILNNSWNISYDNESDVPDDTPSSYKTAINYFINNAGIGANGSQTGPMKGGLVLFSAGNNSRTKSQPSMYDKVIAVGATGPAGEPANYTNYGDWVDICAPGGNHASPYANEIAQIYSTKAGGTYGALQGTSMACPVVSGVAALLVSHFGGPGFTCEALKELLLGGANRELSAKHNKAIGPVLDAYASFTEQGKTLEPVSKIYTSIDKKSVIASVAVQAYGSDPVYSYMLALSTDKNSLVQFDPFNVPSGVTTLTVNTTSYKIGGRASVEFKNLSPGKYYLTAVAFTRTHRYSEGNSVLEIEVYGNRAPVVTPASIQPFSLTHNQKAEYIFEYSDPDGDKVTIDLERGSMAAKWTRRSSNSLLLSIDGGAAAPGTYTAVLTVTDNSGLPTEISVEYTILPNSNPVISSSEQSGITVAYNQSTSIDFTISDYENDSLSVQTDPGSNYASWVKVSDTHYRLDISGNTLEGGQYEAIISASDNYEGIASSRFIYLLKGNKRPEIVSAPPSLFVKAGEHQAIHLDQFFNDPEDDPLQYTVTSDSGSTRLTVSGDLLDIQAGDIPVIAKVAITATDGKTDPVSTSFLIRTYVDSTADIYPTKVSDKLTIIAAIQGKGQIRIISSSGKTILNKSVNLSPFEPYVVDMSNCAPGVYTVTVSIGNTNSKHRIVKI